jgi:hypothetical protein
MHSRDQPGYPRERFGVRLQTTSYFCESPAGGIPLSGWIRLRVTALTNFARLSVYAPLGFALGLGGLERYSSSSSSILSEM